MPTVSVIIPVLNAVRYLPESLQSLRQNCGVQMELVVVDDGSTDHSLEIVRESGLASTILKQSRRGPAAARNRGLEVASGEYVAFLDADDIWPAGTLVRLSEVLEGLPQVGVCQGKVATLAQPEVHPRLRRRILPQPSYTVNLGSALFRRELFRRVGGFDESLRFDEDTDLWMRLWEAGVEKERIPDVTLQYRLHAENMTVEAEENSRALLVLLKKHKDRMAGRTVSPQKQGLAIFLGWTQP